MPIDKKRGDKTRFAQVPREVSKDQRLTLSDLRILLFLLSHTADWHVRRTHLANELGMNEKTVRESLKHLQALGYADPIREQKGKQSQAINWIIRAEPVKRPAVEPEDKAQNPGSTSSTPRASGPEAPWVYRPTTPGSTGPGRPGPGDPPKKNERTQSELTKSELTQSEATQTRTGQQPVAAGPVQKASAPAGGWRTTDEVFSAWVEWQLDEYEANAEEHGGHYDRQAMKAEYWKDRANLELLDALFAPKSPATSDAH